MILTMIFYATISYSTILYRSTSAGEPGAAPGAGAAA